MAATCYLPRIAQRRGEKRHSQDKCLVGGSGVSKSSCGGEGMMVGFRDFRYRLGAHPTRQDGVWELPPGCASAGKKSNATSKD